MPATKKQDEMRQRFVTFYLDGDVSTRGRLKEAASLAGYSWVTVTAKQAKLRAMVADEEARRRERRKTIPRQPQPERKPLTEQEVSAMLPVAAQLADIRERRAAEQGNRATLRFSRAYDQRDQTHESATQWFRDDPAPLGTTSRLDLTSMAAHERRVRGSRWNLANSYAQKFPIRNEN